MPPAGRHIGKRDQHEGAVLQTRMGQDEAVGRDACLPGGIEPLPPRKGFPIREDGIAEREQIKVERAHSPALQALAAELRLDGVKAKKNFIGGESAGVKNRDGVDIIGSGTCRKTGRYIEFAQQYGRQALCGE